MNSKQFYSKLRPYLKKRGVLTLARRLFSPQVRERVAIQLGLGGFTPPTVPMQKIRQTCITKLDGVNYISDLRANNGLGESARQVFQAVRESGIPFHYQEVEVPHVPRTHSLPTGIQTSERSFTVSLIHLIAPEMSYAIERYKVMLEKTFNIGFWLWEVPRFPEDWLPTFDVLDEIWTPSRYTQKIFAEFSPIPVVYIPIPISVPTVQGSRSDFNLPNDRFIFLFSFNPMSSMARKNPYAILEAYRRAFRDTPNPPLLVIKTHHLDSPLNSVVAAKFRATVKEVGAILIEKNLTRQEMYNLLGVCDCYISLHRAEGFGLGLAESMGLGKPVIATAYSANTDFMTNANSFGVRYSLREITHEDHKQQPFLLDIYKAQPGQVWAEPDVDHAAKLMLYVFEHPEEAQQKGITARADITKNLSIEAVGKLIRERLNQLQN